MKEVYCLDTFRFVIILVKLLIASLKALKVFPFKADSSSA